MTTANETSTGHSTRTLWRVNEVSKLTGVSIRTLQYYDRIGLLHPAKYTEAGYRLYDDAALEILQQILLFRELEFPLKDIKEIISRPDFDRGKALGQQIELLKLKKEHLGSKSSRMRTDELIIALSICAQTDEYAARALSAISKLRGAQIHSSVILSYSDENVLTKLGACTTCEPAFAEKCLFHR